MIAKIIASELGVNEIQIQRSIDLLKEGATVPFIARYRKEVTGNLTDTDLRQLETRLEYLEALEARRATILSEIKTQNKLTPELEAQILAADNKQRLEDLYLPYKPKKRNKAQEAIEAGLLTFAQEILLQEKPAETLAEAYLNPEKGINNINDAIEGAKQILAMEFAENADLIQKLRDLIQGEGFIFSEKISEENKEAEKFKDYFEHSELLNKVPSHRSLAMLRGRNLGVLSLSIDLSEKGELDLRAIDLILDFLKLNSKKVNGAWLAQVVRWSWKIKIFTKLQTEFFANLKEQAETRAIEVFAENLKDILLAAPAGAKNIIGLDPGIRTGVKLALIDITGKILHTDTIYPFAPQRRAVEAINTLLALSEKYKVDLIAIGNGTASRETAQLVDLMLEKISDKNLRPQKVIVNEAGASVYSASESAAKELPDLDVTLRGAVSIARRLQDPLAELVKIEPKAIGVGQYQHDVNQTQLAKALDKVVEDSVNKVGVNLNTASVALLEHISGLNKRLAENLVDYRNTNGAFKDRQELLQVKQLGAKAFEQCAGFLRIPDAKNPLDSSSVHPESYFVVENIATAKSKSLLDLIQDRELLNNLKAQDFVSEKAGLPTIIDIIKELQKPGLDIRGDFKLAEFNDEVKELQDLKAGMILEGVVTNVTAFGAFVDLGVHQDGLVHISELSNSFIEDAREMVKAGDIIKVKVLSLDIERKRIGLSCNLSAQSSATNSDKTKSKDFKENGKFRGASAIQVSHSGNSNNSKNNKAIAGNNAMANALQKALQKSNKK